MSPPTYPARPRNGGPLHTAAPKLGRWFYEPKYNEWRALIHGPTRRMWNRNGQPLSIAVEFPEALDELQRLSREQYVQWWDCGALERRHGIGQGCLIVLDWIVGGGGGARGPRADEGGPPEQSSHPWATMSWLSRRGFLGQLMPELPLAIHPRDDFPIISCPPNWDASDARLVWAEMPAHNAFLKAEFYEGMVAKLDSAPYPVQLTSPDIECACWVKHRYHVKNQSNPSDWSDLSPTPTPKGTYAVH